ncbi:MAG: glycosyltransferase [Lachnospiraceae bacterium]|nr:glycosyltransferase [Lachnospiraceae bacterium]
MKEQYTWAAYLEEAYRNQKKINAQLAGKLQDAETKVDELNANLTRIQSSIPYKMTAPFRFCVKGVKAVKSRAGRKGLFSGSYVQAKDTLVAAYEKELSKQQNPYAQWIANVETTLPLGEIGDEAEVAILSYQDLDGRISMQELLSEEAFAKVKYLLFAENPDYLDERCPGIVSGFFRENGDCKVWYAHEDFITKEGKRHHPFFKPVWSPETLLGFFYPASFFALRKEDVYQIMLFHEQDGRQNAYELCLQAVGAGKGGMTDAVLYHIPKEEEELAGDTSKLETTVSPDYRKFENYWGYEERYIPCRKRALEARGFLVASGDTYIENVTAVWPNPSYKPLISVVIPSKDHPDVLKTCLMSFLNRTNYENVEFIVVDNGSSEENQKTIRDLMDTLGALYGKKMQYLYRVSDFNFSKMCNDGVAKAQGDFVLLLNDDIEIIQKDWLDIMLGQALVPGVGAVGAKLWYPGEERIQHAGITNLAIGPSHKLVTFPEDRLYYYGHGATAMNMVAVTAACLLVSRFLYQDMGGLMEDMAVAYNDVEFCFRLHDMGYRNVQRNDAVLRHHESLSRGLDEGQEEKWNRLLQEKDKLYKRHPGLLEYDPYYSNHMKKNSPEYVVGYDYDYEKRLLTQEVKTISYSFVEAMQEGKTQYSLESCKVQPKHLREEPDIWCLEGWCFANQKDNASFTTYVLLTDKKQLKALQVPVAKHYRYDLEEVFPAETHIGLSGFTCRILKKDLAGGSYEVSLGLYDETSDKWVKIKTEGECE